MLVFLMDKFWAVGFSCGISRCRLVFQFVGSGLDESAAGSLWCSFCFILIRLALLLARVGLTRVKSGSEFFFGS